MKHMWESAAHGTIAVTLVSAAQVQDFLTKLLSSLIIAVASATIAHFAQRYWRRREWSKWSKRLGPKP